MDHNKNLTTGFSSFFNLNRQNSAFIRLSLKQQFFILFLLAVLFSSLFINPLFSLKIIFTLIIGFYSLDLLFNFFLIYRSFSKEPEISFSEIEILGYRESWPMYTIFCPLYKEIEVLPQFLRAIQNIDYPKERLEVLLLLEEDDLRTITQARLMGLPDYFKIVVVPDSKPKTKPKACNYGLLTAKGEYCVIYDAEDVPDTYQIKKAVMAFEKLGVETGCIQAKLNFYNSHQNILTKLFAADYSLWFNLVLTGLQSINAPIPLGGTSNHFKTDVLRQLGGWDSFNVTEDADLGIRLSKSGLKTAIIDSITLEEATSGVFNWFKQRTRWIKGYIQTYLVHTRDYPFHTSLTSFKNWACFQIIVGGKLLSLFINPMMWLLTITYFVFRKEVGGTIESFFFAPVFYAGVISLVLGNFLYMYYLMLGLTRSKQWDLITFALMTPVYWLMISISAFMAIHELIIKPFHWNKTQHGAHLKVADQVSWGVPAFGTGRLSHV
jgi:glycosyltransferase XagB